MVYIRHFLLPDHFDMCAVWQRSFTSKTLFSLVLCLKYPLSFDIRLTFFLDFSLVAASDHLPDPALAGVFFPLSYFLLTQHVALYCIRNPKGSRSRGIQIVQYCRGLSW